MEVQVDKDVELLSKAAANHLFLAQFEAFRGILLSIKKRDPGLALAILQTIVANGGEFQGVLWSKTCNSPSHLAWLSSLELARYDSPSSIWNLDPEALILMTEFLLVVQSIIYRVSDEAFPDLEAIGNRDFSEVAKNFDSGPDDLTTSSAREELCPVDAAVPLRKVLELGLRRLREAADDNYDPGGSGSKIELELSESESRCLKRIACDQAGLFDALCRNLQIQRKRAERPEDPGLAVSLVTDKRVEPVSGDELLQWGIKVFQVVQKAHLELMNEHLREGDVEKAINSIRFLHLNYGVPADEYRMGWDLLRGKTAARRKLMKVLWKSKSQKLRLEEFSFYGKQSEEISCVDYLCDLLCYRLDMASFAACVNSGQEWKAKYSLLLSSCESVLEENDDWQADPFVSNFVLERLAVQTPLRVLFDVVPRIKFQDAIELISMQPIASTAVAWKRMLDLELIHMKYALESVVLALGAMETSMTKEPESYKRMSFWYLQDLRNHLEAISSPPRKILMISTIISMLHMDDIAVNFAQYVLSRGYPELPCLDTWEQHPLSVLENDKEIVLSFIEHILGILKHNLPANGSEVDPNLWSSGIIAPSEQAMEWRISRSKQFIEDWEWRLSFLQQLLPSSTLCWSWKEALAILRAAPSRLLNVCLQRAKYDIGEETVHRFSLPPEDKAALDLAEWVDGASKKALVLLCVDVATTSARSVELCRQLLKQARTLLSEIYPGGAPRAGLTHWDRVQEICIISVTKRALQRLTDFVEQEKPMILQKVFGGETIGPSVVETTKQGHKQRALAILDQMIEDAHKGKRQFLSGKLHNLVRALSDEEIEENPVKGDSFYTDKKARSGTHKVGVLGLGLKIMKPSSASSTASDRNSEAASYDTTDSGKRSLGHLSNKPATYLSAFIVYVANIGDIVDGIDTTHDFNFFSLVYEWPKDLLTRLVFERSNADAAVKVAEIMSADLVHKVISACVPPVYPPRFGHGWACIPLMPSSGRASLDNRSRPNVSAEGKSLIRGSSATSPVTPAYPLQLSVVKHLATLSPVRAVLACVFGSSILSSGSISLESKSSNDSITETADNDRLFYEFALDQSYRYLHRWELNAAMDVLTMCICHLPEGDPLRSEVEADCKEDPEGLALRLAGRGAVSAALEVAESANLSVDLRRELQGRQLVKLLTADPVSGGGPAEASRFLSSFHEANDALPVAMGAMQQLPNLRSKQLLVHFFLKRRDGNMSDAEISQLNAWALGLRVLATLPLPWQQRCSALHEHPLLILEVLLMCKQLESASQVMKEFPSLRDNNLILVYAAKAIAVNMNPSVSERRAPVVVPRTKQKTQTGMPAKSNFSNSLSNLQKEARRAFSWAPRDSGTKANSKEPYRKRKSSGLSPSENTSWEAMASIQEDHSSNALDGQERFPSIATSERWVLTGDKNKDEAIRVSHRYESAPDITLFKALLSLCADETVSAKGALELCITQMKNVLSSQQLPLNASMETVGRAYRATETFVQALIHSKAQLKKLVGSSEASSNSDKSKEADEVSSDAGSSSVSSQCTDELPELVAQADIWLGRAELLQSLLGSGIVASLDDIADQESSSHLRDRLIKDERYSMAVYTCKKCKIDAFRVWNAWGHALIRMERYAQARVKFKYEHLARSAPTILDDSLSADAYLSVLHISTFPRSERSRRSQLVTSHPDVSTSLEDSDDGPRSNLDNARYTECVNYLQEYAKQEMLDFMFRHGRYAEACSLFFPPNAVPPPPQPSHHAAVTPTASPQRPDALATDYGTIDDLCDLCVGYGAMSILEHVLAARSEAAASQNVAVIEHTSLALNRICTYCETHKHFNFLYKFQLHFEEGLSARHRAGESIKLLSKSMRGKSASVKLSEEDLVKFSSRVTIQVNVVKSFNDNDGPPWKHSLFGNPNDPETFRRRCEVAETLAEKNFDLAFQVIYEFNLPAVDIYAAVAKTLAERKKGNQLTEFLRNIKGTIDDSDWDQVLLAAIVIYANKHRERPDRLIDMLKSVHRKVIACVICGRLKTAFQIASRNGSTADVDYVAHQALLSNALPVVDMCRQWFDRYL
ncbi:unnamed protein product [Victoria cruziana]